ncbi:MAG: helix-turn-helix transcriptional regulator [Erythrobacter sp.]|nr:helix-turn-helix transcriptional regulator [Erythrobacter sp.]
MWQYRDRSTVPPALAERVWNIAAHSGTKASMNGTTLRYGLLYGGAIALVAALLQWVEYRYHVMQMPGEAYAAVIAVIFIAIGIWVGRRLTPDSGREEFEPNERAIASLGLTPRELEILGYLAKGASNKEIARSLKVSPNTIKTHIANLYMKLEVTGRGKAVEAARALAVIP